MIELDEDTWPVITFRASGASCNSCGAKLTPEYDIAILHDCRIVVS